MNQLDKHSLSTHVSILGWLNIANGVLFMVIGAFVFMLLIGLGIATGEGEDFAILSIVGTVISGMMLVMALPSFFAGYGLLKSKNWGRILAIIVGGFNLMNFPLGTALGIYTFYVLFQQSATAYFTPLKTA